MASLAEYFAKRDEKNPKPTYEYGDRIFAKFNSIPLVGMVIRENVEEKEVLVHADLPMMHNKKIHSVVWVPKKTIKRLKVIE